MSMPPTSDRPFTNPRWRCHAGDVFMLPMISITFPPLGRRVVIYAAICLPTSSLSPPTKAVYWSEWIVLSNSNTGMPAWYAFSMVAVRALVSLGETTSISTCSSMKCWMSAICFSLSSLAHSNSMVAPSCNNNSRRISLFCFSRQKPPLHWETPMR